MDVGDLLNHVKYCVSVFPFRWAIISTSLIEILNTEQDEASPLKIQVSLCAMYAWARVEKKALQALGVLEAKEDWERMISEGCWWAYSWWVCAGGLKGMWVDGGPELCFRASKGCSNGISSFSPQETIVKVCSLDSRAFGTLVIYESRTLPDKQDGASFQPYSINFAFIHVPMLVLFRKPNHDKVALCNN